MALFLPLTGNALSATTTYTIQGTKPALSFNGGVTIANNLNELFRIKMPDGTIIDSEYEGVLEISPEDSFDKVIANVPADNNAHGLSANYYYDANGDAPHNTTPVAGTLTATWTYIALDGTKKTLSSAELNSLPEPCNAPYTLTISAKNVKAQSAYGDPIDNDYGSADFSYTINVADYKACYAKPNAMIKDPSKQWFGVNSAGTVTSWNDTANTTAHYLNGGGYSSDFVPYGGFKATATPSFPTTGFPQAQFQLKMSNGQRDYTYQVLSHTEDIVSVDLDGNVLIKNKPSGSVTIQATPKVSGYAAINYQFGISLWVIPIASKVAFASARTSCGGQEKMLSRTELTNSPRNTAPGNGSWVTVDNHYTRAIKGGVFGEWGVTMNTTYPNTLWRDVVWSADRADTSDWFVVGIYSGKVNSSWEKNTAYVVCRGN